MIDLMELIPIAGIAGIAGIVVLIIRAVVKAVNKGRQIVKDYKKYDTAGVVHPPQVFINGKPLEQVSDLKLDIEPIEALRKTKYTHRIDGMDSSAAFWAMIHATNDALASGPNVPEALLDESSRLWDSDSKPDYEGNGHGGSFGGGGASGSWDDSSSSSNYDSGSDYSSSDSGSSYDSGSNDY